MPRSTYAVMFALFTAPLFAGSISINGTCELGNCANPDTLADGRSISQSFNFIYTLANGDEFQIQGVLAESNSNGDYINAGTQVTATFLGNGSGAPSGADALTIDLLQNFQHSDTVSSASFTDTLYGGFAGAVAPASTAERDFLVNSTALPPLGPFAFSTKLFSGSNADMVIAGLGNPVLFSNRYIASFGAGSGAGATILMSASPVFGSPAISKNGITPLFSSSNTVQPSSWISIYGSNLAGPTNVWNGNFPTSLGGVSVTIDSKPAYLWYVSPTQINLQVPDDAATGTVSVVVTTLGGTASSTVTLGPYAPSFSLFNSKYPAAIVQTTGPGNSGAGYDYIGPTGAFPFPSRPVAAGETVILFGVGFGPTNPTVPAGQVFSGAAPCVTLPQITIGGITATVAFAGIIEAGLYQFNVVVPNAGSGDQLLQASIGGQTTPAGIYITLQ
jgi:uncharacterized protein (TIGR03437 family)